MNGVGFETSSSPFYSYFDNDITNNLAIVIIHDLVNKGLKKAKEYLHAAHTNTKTTKELEDLTKHKQHLDIQF